MTVTLQKAIFKAPLFRQSLVHFKPQIGHLGARMVSNLVPNSVHFVKLKDIDQKSRMMLREFKSIEEESRAQVKSSLYDATECVLVCAGMGVLANQAMQVGEHVFNHFPITGALIFGVGTGCFSLAMVPGVTWSLQNLLVARKAQEMANEAACAIKACDQANEEFFGNTLEVFREDVAKNRGEFLVHFQNFLEEDHPDLLTKRELARSIYHAIKDQKPVRAFHAHPTDISYEVDFSAINQGEILRDVISDCMKERGYRVFWSSAHPILINEYLMTIHKVEFQSV